MVYNRFWLQTTVHSKKQKQRALKQVIRCETHDSVESDKSCCCFFVFLFHALLSYQGLLPSWPSMEPDRQQNQAIDRLTFLCTTLNKSQCWRRFSILTHFLFPAQRLRASPVTYMHQHSPNLKHRLWSVKSLDFPFVSTAAQTCMIGRMKFTLLSLASEDNIRKLTPFVKCACLHLQLMIYKWFKRMFWCSLWWIGRPERQVNICDKWQKREESWKEEKVWEKSQRESCWEWKWPDTGWERTSLGSEELWWEQHQRSGPSWGRVPWLCFHKLLSLRVIKQSAGILRIWPRRQTLETNHIIEKWQPAGDAEPHLAFFSLTHLSVSQILFFVTLSWSGSISPIISLIPSFSFSQSCKGQLQQQIESLSPGCGGLWRCSWVLLSSYSGQLFLCLLIFPLNIWQVLSQTSKYFLAFWEQCLSSLSLNCWTTIFSLRCVSVCAIHLTLPEFLDLFFFLSYFASPNSPHLPFPIPLTTLRPLLVSSDTYPV